MRQLLRTMRQAFAIAREATYANDGLLTSHNADFLKDERFRTAYRLGKATGSWGMTDLEWRAYIVCWAAAKGATLEGDFVECGVNRGGLARTVVHYTDFGNQPDKTFYLLDTFAGFAADYKQAAPLPNRNDYEECYESVKQTFAAFPNVRLIRGTVPETLPHVPSPRVAFLSIDMNHAAAEIAAAEYFWDKLVPGAVAVLDDYGWSEHYLPQKQAFDRFAEAHQVQVLSLPTGQGLIIKP